MTAAVPTSCQTYTRNEQFQRTKKKEKKGLRLPADALLLLLLLLKSVAAVTWLHLAMDSAARKPNDQQVMPRNRK